MAIPPYEHDFDATPEVSTTLGFSQLVPRRSQLIIKMIGIINYGAGNLRSVWNAITYIGGDVCVLDSPKEILKCTHLLLPGVDHLPMPAESYVQDWKSSIETAVGSGLPMLGICLGMQLLLDVGYEDGESPGLGLIRVKLEVSRACQLFLAPYWLE